MTKIIVGNSDTPLSYGLHYRGLKDNRNPKLNVDLVSHDGEELPPKLNNAPVIKGGGLTGGQLHHSSRMEKLVEASRGKKMSKLDFLKMAHMKS